MIHLEASNGNVAELLELKRKYRKDCADLEAEVKNRLVAELSDKKRELAEKYADDLAKVIAQRLKSLLMEAIIDNE